jgi:hypothetical protein
MRLLRAGENCHHRAATAGGHNPLQLCAAAVHQHPLAVMIRSTRSADVAPIGHEAHAEPTRRFTRGQVQECQLSLSEVHSSRAPKNVFAPIQGDDKPCAAHLTTQSTRGWSDHTDCSVGENAASKIDGRQFYSCIFEASHGIFAPSFRKDAHG